MATYTREVATEFNFPNITIYRVLADGVLSSYEAIPDEGYVMYNTAANNTETQINPETGLEEEVPVTYYYTYRGFPKTKNFANFTWVAVPRSSVDENYIFGGGDNNDHEVM